MRVCTWTPLTSPRVFAGWLWSRPEASTCHLERTGPRVLLLTTLSPLCCRPLGLGTTVIPPGGQAPCQAPTAGPSPGTAARSSGALFGAAHVLWTRAGVPAPWGPWQPPHPVDWGVFLALESLPGHCPSSLPGAGTRSLQSGLNPQGLQLLLLPFRVFLLSPPQTSSHLGVEGFEW